MLHPADIASKSLKFANANGTMSSFGDLIGNNEGKDSKIKSLIDRSRGLF